MNLPAAMPAPATSTVAGPQLRDIHLPPAPSWWPPAPGWWLLAVVVLLALAWAARTWSRGRRYRQRKAALLAMVDAAVAQTKGSPHRLAASLHAVLRRAARSLDPAADTQRGDAWRATLATLPVDAHVIDRLCALDTQIYRPASAFEHEPTVDAVRQWLAALADRRRRAKRTRSSEPQP